jgi:dihydroorotate dehydrogenase (NAD+) catalytic subunit
MLCEPFYDPARSYLENFDHGPFGGFADAMRWHDEGGPAHTFLGHAVHAPFGIPAGPLLNGNFVKAALDHGFDLPVYKTVRTRKYASHPWPNVLAVHPEGDLPATRQTLVADEHYTEPLSITNSFGVPSFDPEFWQPDMADAVRSAHKGQVVIASFQGTKGEGGVEAYIEDYRVGARLVKETGATICEVNFSCPNEGTSNLLCFDIPRAAAIAAAIKEVFGDDVKLVTKMAYFADDAQLAMYVREVCSIVDGVSAINTISAEVVDASGKQALPGDGRLFSGVCGRSIRWAGLEMTARLKRHREESNLDFAIVGVGGVTGAADFEAYRNAGADAVMSATGAMWHLK